MELKKDRKYNILLIELDGNFAKKLRKFRPDLVLNLLHGRYEKMVIFKRYLNLKE